MKFLFTIPGHFAGQARAIKRAGFDKVEWRTMSWDRSTTPETPLTHWSAHGEEENMTYLALLMPVQDIKRIKSV